MLTNTSLSRGLTDSRLTALIVDGDPQLRRSMATNLAGMNFSVLSANHYDGAVEHLTTRDFHFAIVDVQLPSKSGYELCEHMRGALGLLGLPILMTSEYGNPEDMAYAEAAGGNAFLHKPFSMQELTRCVEFLLDASRRGALSSHELQPLVSSKRRLAGYVPRAQASMQAFAQV